MNRVTLSTLRRHLPKLAVIAITVTAYSLAKLPMDALQWRYTPPAFAAPLVKGIDFRPHVLPALAPPGEARGVKVESVTEGGSQRRYYVRPVHPSLSHLRSWISSVGAGVAAADLDGDGLPNDLCYVDTRVNQVIVTAAPGPGADRYQPFAILADAHAETAGWRGADGRLLYDPATMAPMGALPGDFNEDGRMDLLVYFWGRTPLLFLRQPAAIPLARDSFRLQETLPGSRERWFTNALAQADVDGDGHLDLIVGNYFADGSRILDAGDDPGNRQQMPYSMSAAYNGGAKHFLLWQPPAPDLPSGAVSYRDEVTFMDDKKLEQEVTHGWTLAIGVQDLDLDGRPEIYFANDFGPDRLLYNRSAAGEPRFNLVHGEAGFEKMKSGVCGRDSNKGMGVAFGDISGQGRSDIFVSNITAPFALQESQFAYCAQVSPGGMAASLRAGRAPFTNRAEELAMSRTGWGWDVQMADFNNGGRPEIIQALGFIKGTRDGWALLHEAATGNDACLHDPRFWNHFLPGIDLCTDEPPSFFVNGDEMDPPQKGWFNAGRNLACLWKNLPEDAHGRTVCANGTLENNEPVRYPVSRGIAIADCDHDGRQDFAMANQWEPSYFYHNTGSGLPTNGAGTASGHAAGAFLGLTLTLPCDENQPAGPDRPAIGATAVLELKDGRVMHAQVDGGNGHSGKASPEIHFGLGRHVKHGQAHSVMFQWRDATGVLRWETKDFRAAVPTQNGAPPPEGMGWGRHRLGTGTPITEEAFRSRL